jgi:mono/diheme cytochrome c family protein
MRSWTALLALLPLLGCGGGAEATSVERGRQVYVASCTACHHPDPSLDGSVGPAVAGASAELVRARVLRGEYPPGYTPKRSSALMPPQPHLEPQIDDLVAYLASVGSTPR